jgi:uncharacterized protein YcbK (DUF882 family)
VPLQPFTHPVRRLVLTGLLAALAGCAGRAPAPSDQEIVLPELPAVRRIVLRHKASGERLDVVYFSSGQYDPSVMARVRHLLRDRVSGEVGPIDPLLLDFIYDLLSRTGLPSSTEVLVFSGFRSPQTNAQLIKRGAPAGRESFHLQGKAIDLKVGTLPGPALAEIAKTMQRGGAAFYPATGHLHIDTGPVRTWKAR